LFDYRKPERENLTEKKADSLRSIWTYHEGVALVMEVYLIENIKEEWWRTRMIVFCHNYPDGR